ncbi:MAG: SUMF1/EgtB/PvdO family nonheme iron enzyme [Planctomycetota bacterium]
MPARPSLAFTLASLACCLLSGAALAQSDRAIGVEAVYTAPVAEAAPAGNAGLFVGINTFTDDRGIRPLRYAVNDAVAQAHLFVVELRLIAPNNAFLALAGEPSTDSARQQLAALRAAGVAEIPGRKTSVLRQLLLVEKLPNAASDLLVVSISSHGFEEDGTAYAMPTDGLRGILGDTAIDLGTVEHRLARSKAGKRLLILDACRERPSADGKGGDLPMTAAFRGALANARGQAVLASCDAGQLSYENDALGHGVFTYFLLEALRGQAHANPAGHITLGAVSDHVATRVRDWAVRHRPGLEAERVQRPWFKGPNDARDIPLALRKSGERPGDVSPPALPPVATPGEGVVPGLPGAGGVEQVLRQLDAFDRQREEALELYLPTSSYVQKIEQAKADYLKTQGPQLLAAYESAVGTLAQLRKEMREIAPPVVAAKRQVNTLEPVVRSVQADALVSQAASTTDPEAALRLLNKALALAPDHDQAKTRRLDLHVELGLSFFPMTPDQARVIQQSSANRHHRNRTTLTNSIGMELAYIPSGEFLMGSPASEEGRDDDERQHRVRLTKPFLLGTTEVTQSQWRSVMGNNPPSRFKGDDLPVDWVSWDDAVEFCRRLSQKESKRYRLPTESEWEYACRAGTTTPFYFGSTISTDQANYDGDYIYGTGRKGVDRKKTIPVGSFQPNSWGLYDMHGNVFEWCSDRYGDYSNVMMTDPTGLATGESRVLRGGSWSFQPAHCRSASRIRRAPDSQSFSLGFRVALDLN